MKNKTPSSDNVSTTVDHAATTLDALKQAEELYGIQRLSSCKSAHRVVKRFIEITENSDPDLVANLKSKEIAEALYHIGMRENPEQFGESVQQSLEPLKFSDNGKKNPGTDEQQQLQSKNLLYSRISHKMVFELSSRVPSQDDYKAECAALKYLHKASDALGIPRDYFVKREDFSISGPEKPAGPIADERPEDQINPVYRPPKVEALSGKPHLLNPNQAQALWRLVDASCFLDEGEAQRKDKGSTSNSLKAQSIRELIRKIGIDGQFKNSGQRFSRILETLADLLALVDCHVDAENVRQVFIKQQAKVPKSV